MARLRSRRPVFATPEADAASKADLRRARKVASKHMCCSSTEDRTWVELTEDVVKEYRQWLLLPSNSGKKK